MRIPFFSRRFIELGIGKQSQADDPGGVAVKRAERNVFAARADFDARIFLFVLEGVGRTIFAARIEPEPEAVRARTGGFLETRLVDQAEITPAVIAAEMLDARMRGKRFQKIQLPAANDGQKIPGP